jgi:hypothetical protein
MKRTLRRRNAPTKKWSMNEKWFGARITGPDSGTFCEEMQRPRKTIQTSHEHTSRTRS